MPSGFVFQPSLLMIPGPRSFAFGLLSIGGVTLLYTFALPGRRDDGDDEEDDSAPFHRHR